MEEETGRETVARAAGEMAGVEAGRVTAATETGRVDVMVETVAVAVAVAIAVVGLHGRNRKSASSTPPSA